jgi:hypothetical protein
MGRRGLVGYCIRISFYILGFTPYPIISASDPTDDSALNNILSLSLFFGLRVMLGLFHITP